MEEDPSWLRLSRSEMRGSGSGVAGVSESVGAGAAIPVGAGARAGSILSQPWSLTPDPELALSGHSVAWLRPATTIIPLHYTQQSGHGIQRSWSDKR